MLCGNLLLNLALVSRIPILNDVGCCIYSVVVIDINGTTTRAYIFAARF